MKLAMVQMKVIAGNIEENKVRGLELAKQAATQADIVVLPEIWTIGYSLKNIEIAAETLDGALLGALADLARKNGVTIVAGSVPLKVDGRIYNSSVVIDKLGDRVTSYEKVHLFTMYGEERFFAPGNNLNLFELGEFQAGLAICYDLRFPELFRSLALKGAQIVILPAEWPSARAAHWHTLVKSRAIENQVYICAVNCVGEHKGNSFYGHSLLVAPDGEVISEGSEEEEIVYGDINLAKVIETRKSMGIFNDRRPDLY